MQALCQVLDSAGQLCMHTAVLHPTNMQARCSCCRRRFGMPCTALLGFLHALPEGLQAG